MRYSLLVTSANGARQIVSVGDMPVTVGRLPSSTICVDEAPVSRQHCVIIPTGAGLTVLDQGSTNGTYVNDYRRQHARLQHNDEVKVGGTRIRVDAVPEAASEREGKANKPPQASTPLPAMPAPLQPSGQVEFLANFSKRLALLGDESLGPLQVLSTLVESFPVQRAMILRQKSWDAPLRVKPIAFRSDDEVSLPAEVLNRKLVKRVMASGRADVELPAAEGQTPQYIWDAALCAPLHHQGRLVGALYVDTSTPTKWLEQAETLSFFTAVANIVSLALDLSPPGATDHDQPRRAEGREAAAEGSPAAEDLTASQARRLEAERILLTERLNQLEHLERARSTLHRGLVHDIKNLVGALNSNHSFLREALEEGTDQMEAMDDALEITKRIVAMAEDVLALSRMEDGSFPLTTREVNVGDLLARTLRRHATQAREQSISLALGPVDDGLEAFVDVAVVDRMLDNLVGNALRHAGESGWVILSAESFQGGAEITVADSGPSVPPAERDRVFNEWYSAEGSRSRHHGIGLYFCRVAAEAHGGSVRIEGAPGDNRVVIHLPAAASELSDITTDVGRHVS